MNKINNEMDNEKKLTEEKRLTIIEAACQQIGKGAFFSTIIIVASFLPVFMLTGQEGKLFSPLAWTKTFILFIDAFIAVTLVPVLISFFLKGKCKPENKNPINRGLMWFYSPLGLIIPRVDCSNSRA